ncbi:hypothetical protein BOTBODRAFT_490445 [Botryobasidium botryosum FD-172 SS1]|uniref:Uncharacterized protein n=1 Tax=Botryobasidium botryosum (strain FD-172 SS1) TaxID=930990 RepID=A0A067MFC3_BOTB1|nr:hypothetical protein BOTBODRAFT_490445 [Botryobasidium botryosum FD-172 SS1]
MRSGMAALVSTLLHPTWDRPLPNTCPVTTDPCYRAARTSTNLCFREIPWVPRFVCARLTNPSGLVLAVVNRWGSSRFLRGLGATCIAKYPPGSGRAPHLFFSGRHADLQAREARKISQASLRELLGRLDFLGLRSNAYPESNLPPHPKNSQIGAYTFISRCLQNLPCTFLHSIFFWDLDTVLSP